MRKRIFTTSFTHNLQVTMKKSVLHFLLGLLPLCGYSQLNMSSSLLANYSSEEEPIKELIALLEKDYTYKVQANDTENARLYQLDKKDVPVYSTSVVAERMYNIRSIVPLTYNSYVQRYIDVYTLEKREQVQKMLGLTAIYFPLIEEELDRRQMPMELKYLTVVESALNAHARSRVGATGLWQFMLGTGQEYGLRVDSYIDERKDPYKSTRAALSYLQKSYNMFGDWLLALASYNCGPNNVKKAIARAGGVNDYWAIRDYLPAETRGYVPAFIAVVYAFNYAQEHNLYPIKADFSLNQDSIHIKGMDISLYNIAEMSGASYDELRNLNPEIKMGVIPYSSYESYIVRVPHSVATYFATYSSAIYEKYSRKIYSSYSAGYTVTEYPSSSVPAYLSTPVVSTAYTSPAPATNPSTNTSNENLSYTENGNLVGDVEIGASFLPEKTSTTATTTRGTPSKTPPIPIAKTSTASSTKTAAKPTSPATKPKAKETYHTVKSGDTLWEIAQKYGVTVQDLRKINGNAVQMLTPGEKLKVK